VVVVVMVVVVVVVVEKDVRQSCRTAFKTLRT